jgi:hypothetical protein
MVFDVLAIVLARVAANGHSDIQNAEFVHGFVASVKPPGRGPGKEDLAETPFVRSTTTNKS